MKLHEKVLDEYNNRQQETLNKKSSNIHIDDCWAADRFIRAYNIYRVGNAIWVFGGMNQYMTCVRNVRKNKQGLKGSNHLPGMEAKRLLPNRGS